MSARTEEERIAALEADLADLRADFESFRAEIRNEIKVEPAPVETEPKITTPAVPTEGQQAGIPVYAVYKGERIANAILQFDVSNSRRRSKVIFEGEELGANKALLKALRKVNPARKSPSGMGWTFWKLRDPDGNKERPISDLRDDEGLRRRMLGMD